MYSSSEVLLHGGEGGLRWYVDLNDDGTVSLRFKGSVYFRATQKSISLENLPDAFWADMRTAAKLVRKKKEVADA